MTDILVSLGFSCSVQLIENDGSKPFLSARVKFASEAQLQLALLKVRSFELRDGKCCRLLPFDPLLSRNINAKVVMNEKNYDPNQCEYDVLIKPEATANATKDTQDAFPDNSSQQVNVFVKGLDRSWTANDLYELFEEYGEIKSAKISLNPQSHRSNGYGFVWFALESSAKKAIQASKSHTTPLTIEPYKPRSLYYHYEEHEVCVDLSIVVFGFGEDTLEDELIKHFL